MSRSSPVSPDCSSCRSRDGGANDRPATIGRRALGSTSATSERSGDPGEFHAAVVGPACSNARLGPIHAAGRHANHRSMSHGTQEPATTTANAARLFGDTVESPGVMATPALIGAMLDVGPGISDLLFSPGRPPQVERHGLLVPVPVGNVGVLQPQDTARIARDLIANHDYALQMLADQGACDCSFALPGRFRFRVNVFRQRGSYAVVMRSEERRVG